LLTLRHRANAAEGFTAPGRASTLKRGASVMGDDDLRRDLGRTLADPKLSGLSAFSNAAKREQERHAIGGQDVRWTVPDTSQSFVASLKTIGRNDPCPCGSGKKFKKCCLQ
jgi:hypothetical protein